VAIYQDLVERFAFEHKYNSVKRFCRVLRKKHPAQYDRLEFVPGEEAQVGAMRKIGDVLQNRFLRSNSCHSRAIDIEENM
jgi:hypothetical protein